MTIPVSAVASVGACRCTSGKRARRWLEQGVPQCVSCSNGRHEMGAEDEHLADPYRITLTQSRRLSRPPPMRWKPNVVDARLAIIGDTHLRRGSRRLPEECVRRLAMADLILHTGDHCFAARLRNCVPSDHP
jgi:hypothetical protein